MGLTREPVTITLLHKQNSLIGFENLSLHRQINVALTPQSKKLILIYKWRPLKKNTTGFNSEINELWGAQHQWIHLQHNSCAHGSGKIAEKDAQQKDYERQRTRKSAMTLYFLEMAV